MNQKKIFICMPILSQPTSYKSIRISSLTFTQFKAVQNSLLNSNYISGLIICGLKVHRCFVLRFLLK